MAEQNLQGAPEGAGIRVDCTQRELDDLLGLEWLRTNRYGAYSASTAAGCNTRRYHGLLVAATQPPLGRIVALSTVMERLYIHNQPFDLATNEFPGTFSPRGEMCLQEFRDDSAATFVYRIDRTTLVKRVVLSRKANSVAVHYRLLGPADRLVLRPLVALRDYHQLRHAHRPNGMGFDAQDSAVTVHEPTFSAMPLHMEIRKGFFRSAPQWWYQITYRADAARGQDATEDLYSPGQFVWTPDTKRTCKFVASLGEPNNVSVKKTVRKRRKKHLRLLRKFPNDALSGHLASVAETFLVNRVRHDEKGLSILAGFPWFADWGRDTFIALPGLLLVPGRRKLARRVLGLYAGEISRGMVPNRFDDYGRHPHYNSIDASLWFLLAVERYLASGAGVADPFWADVLQPACIEILSSYREGTRFGIAAGEDELLTGGTGETQLTWMDAQVDGQPVTPRAGRAVECNSLWYCAHRALAERLADAGDSRSGIYHRMADRIGESFRRTFWNEAGGYLYDVVGENGGDASLRPNQIFAVSLPYSPLTPAQQRSVVQTVREALLTPRGLRTLAPSDPRYQGRYEGSWAERDAAYHQGTVWAWLMGAFVEAWLKIQTPEALPAARAEARTWLDGFGEHLAEAGLGSISEIFDGDAPHTPRGCFAQAWSVGEILRARWLVENAACDSED